MQIKPDLADKFNSDYWADCYADALGIDPELIVPNNQVALIRQQRAEAQQAQAQMEQAQQMSQVAKNLTGLEGGITTPTNAEMMSQFMGY